jgi:hypothetical protein
MKYLFPLFKITLLAFIISACSTGGGKIKEIKLIPVRSGELFQYINPEGKIIINPQFKQASIFIDGLALVKTSGDESKWGYISEDGRFAIPAKFIRATAFNDGLAWVVSDNEAPSAIDKKGEIQFTLKNAEQVKRFENGFAAYSIADDEEKWGFVNKKGETVINPQFSLVSNFNEDRCAVRNEEGKWGYIDKNGLIVINYQFDEAGDFINGKSVVSSDGKAGIIDKNGKYFINPQYHEIQNDGNLYLVNQDGKYGWLDKEGKTIINPQFNMALPFSGNKITSVQSGKSFGYIDNSGKILINPQFDFALSFNGNLALVSSNNKIGFIDREGKYSINPQFEEISDDYVMYIMGKSLNHYVSTDYFDASDIISIIDLENPEGLNFLSTFNNLSDKFNIPQSKFSKYSDQHQIHSRKRINNYSSYSFYVDGSPYDKVKVQRGSGWYVQTVIENVYNPHNKIKGFSYVLSLAGNHYGKNKMLGDALDSKLIQSGFKVSKGRIEGEYFICADGQAIVASYYKDSDCDCRDCSDEVDNLNYQTYIKGDVLIKFNVNDLKIDIINIKNDNSSLDQDEDLSEVYL